MFFSPKDGFHIVFSILLVLYSDVCSSVRFTKKFGFHFILGGLNCYVLTSKKYVHTVLQNVFAAFEVWYG